jgi:hypothetical protein
MIVIAYMPSAGRRLLRSVIDSSLKYNFAPTSKDALDLAQAFLGQRSAPIDRPQAGKAPT